MSQPWKLLPLAAVIAVIGALLLAPGGVTQPRTATAEFPNDCPNGAFEGNLIIEIIDDDTNDPITIAGTIVRVSPDPSDAQGTDNVVDNGPDDSDDDPGIILLEDVCADNEQGNQAEYSVELILLPNALEDCEIEDATDSDFAPEDNETVTLTLEVDCQGVGTPTATATTTVTVTTTAGPAATVTTSASPGTVQCTGTSIVTIQVRDAAGNPVPAGTAVTISTNLGEVAPSSGQTTDASGNAFVFFSGKGVGGVATILAKAGNAQGTTSVTVNCGATPSPTTAPPPTVAPGGGVISPPNTGDAGLADRDGQGWTAFAGIGLLLIATAGAAAIVKVRA